MMTTTTMTLLMTARMQKCHQSYVRALANCREASERAKEEEKEWEEGRASEIYADGRTDGRTDGRRRTMQVMQKYDKSHSAFHGRHSTGMAGEGRHARIRSDEGFISKAAAQSLFQDKNLL